MQKPRPEDHSERMVPELHQPSLLYAEHYTRYLAAQPLVAGKRVLDIASGSGYGSHLLAQGATSVVGVDISSDAVEYATATYTRPNLEFRRGDATAIPLDDGSVDVVVTFETIEHVTDYRAFLAEVERVLAPDGIALVSTPNDIEFVEGNHFHLHQFVYDELLDLLGEWFPHREPYFQATWAVAAVGPQSMFSTAGPVEAAVVNLAPLQPDQYLYFYVVCSKRPVHEVIPSIVGFGAHHSDRALQLEARVRDDETARVLAREVESARAELTTIVATRSYRLARRLSRLASIVRRERAAR